MIYWDPNPDLFTLPVLKWPITWYGVLFATGFALGFLIFKDLLFRYFLLLPSYAAKMSREELKRKALMLTDRLNIYMIVATVVGARVGHFLFYERPSDYLKNPMELLHLREGGLASHGAALAILFALWLFSRVIKTQAPDLTWLRLLDFVSPSVALAGALIRIGNFINQEILGTRTSVPWAVVFGHPLDGSIPVPRHPVQLYEALFYLFVFFVLWRLTYRPKLLLAKGMLIGIFLSCVFGFRLVIEFLKLEQSRLLTSSAELTMGQWLSIPFLILGVVLVLCSKRSPNV